MKESTRFRITGAVFLVAVGLIFVPMLFDVKREPVSTIQPIERQPIEVVPSLPEPPQLEPVVAAQEELRELVSDDGFLTESSTRVGEAVLEEVQRDSIAPAVQADDRQWAIQLGSFSSKVNAKNLVRKVAKDDHHVWTSTAKVNDHEVFRVAVGPFFSHEEASTQREQLSEQYTLNAIVVRYGMR